MSNQEHLDAVELEIRRNQLESIAEEMGEVLIRGAYSPNITERKDCSTALFDADGRMVAQAEHIPVHLGAMPAAVDAVRETDPQPGDVVALNDPFRGGTHLPDITLVSPIGDAEDQNTIVGYAVSRAHHADVGGMAPGSMPAGAREIHQEGLRIPPIKLVDDGDVVEDIEALLLANVRARAERQADLRAQIGANQRGAERVAALQRSLDTDLQSAFEAVVEYSRQRMASELDALPDGTYHAVDYLEGDGVTDEDIPIEATLTVDGPSIEVDFTGTAPQVTGSVNAPLAVATSAVYFVLRVVTDPDIPPNHGCYAPITVEAPEGCLLNPEPPAAVSGGNVETSQRVTDVVFAALAEAAPEAVPAAGQGTMNNLVVGAPDFAYYETIGGGAGARPNGDGLSGVQVGMTNTLNTPIEALEAAYPLRVQTYEIREGSGGDGEYRGGDGLVRAITTEQAATVSLLTERRRRGPPGRAGGQDGTPGLNFIDDEAVGAKTTREVQAGTTVRVETPGGGGYGPASDHQPNDGDTAETDDSS